MAHGPTIYVLGSPGPVGGAGTELWDTLRLWISGGFNVHLIPTWGKMSSQWQRACRELGCTLHEIDGFEQLPDVPGIEGQNVTAFCSAGFLDAAPTLKRLGCRLIWVNCMCWLFEKEKKFYEEHGPFDVYVCQSLFQRAKLLEQLEQYDVGPDRVAHIPGGFWLDDWPYAPKSHQPGETFVLGRVSRADAGKFSSNTWPIWSEVAYANKEGRVLGYRAEKLEKKLGKPPEWVKTYEPGKVDAKEFHRGLHALVQISGGATENWPRVGLEAMATGDVVVAQNQWGWKEMVRSGETGFLCSDNRSEIAHRVATLAWDEKLRLDMAAKARERVEILARPEPFLKSWQKVIWANEALV